MEKQILLIDDDPNELEIFTSALKKIPAIFSCTQALSADEALVLLQQQRPDFIFIDYNMPVKNGLETLEELKKKEELKHSRFIIYSNSITEETANHARRLGADICMKKPYLVSTLAQRLKEIMAPYLDN